MICIVTIWDIFLMHVLKLTSSQDALMKNAQTVQKALGYRYILSEFTYNKKIENGQAFNISFKVKNEGSSPFTTIGL